MNRTRSWFQIIGDDYYKVWAPEIAFRKVTETEIIPLYGKSIGKYDFWANNKNGSLLMTFYQSVKVTVSCDFDFSTFPFDHHHCDFDFGCHLNIYNGTVKINPIRVINNDSTPAVLDFNKKIYDKHLPYDFSITGKDEYPLYNHEFFAPFTGITIHMKRKEFGQLVGSFYVPTAIFSGLSTLSFFINPDVVPGRMGLLITLFLISSNVYGSVNAPINRGFSHIETWVLGVHGIMLLAICEYGFVLCWKFVAGIKVPTNLNKTWAKKIPKSATSRLTLEEKIKILDLISFFVSVFLYILFNLLYWFAFTND